MDAERFKNALRFGVTVFERLMELLEDEQTAGSRRSCREGRRPSLGRRTRPGAPSPARGRARAGARVREACGPEGGRQTWT
jgi:hypothetical protein